MEGNYKEVVKSLLGYELFKELSDGLFNKVNKKYPRIDIREGIKIVEANLGIILVIGVEKGRGCTDNKLKERVDWYKICPKSMMIENSINDMAKTYERFIDVIKQKAIEKEKQDKKSNM